MEGRTLVFAVAEEFPMRAGYRRVRQPLPCRCAAAIMRCLKTGPRRVLMV
jgi:hypothetical protein